MTALAFRDFQLLKLKCGEPRTAFTNVAFNVNVRPARPYATAPFFAKLDDATLSFVNYDFVDGNGEVDRAEMREAVKFFFPQDDAAAAWRKHPGWRALDINGSAFDLGNDTQWVHFAEQLFRLEGEQEQVEYQTFDKNLESASRLLREDISYMYRPSDTGFPDGDGACYIRVVLDNGNADTDTNTNANRTLLLADIKEGSINVQVMVRRCRLTVSSKPVLKAKRLWWSQRLEIKHDGPLSSFAVKCKVRH